MFIIQEDLKIFVVSSLVLMSFLLIFLEKDFSLISISSEFQNILRNNLREQVFD